MTYSIKGSSVRGANVLEVLSIKIVIAAVALLAFSQNAGATIKIMPLGDSITVGGNQTGDVPGGYRRELDACLRNGGYDFDFVGTQTNNPAPGIDPDHNGMNAFRTDQILASMWEWLLFNPDGVLLHIGTNDLLQQVPPSTAAANLAIIVDRILNNSSHPVVFLATIIPILNDGDGTPPEEWAAKVAEYNNQVRSIARHAIDQGKNVYLVDMFSELNDSQYYRSNEGVHPNEIGYDRMGDKWYTVLKAEGSLLTKTPPPLGPPNLALRKPATASSVYGAGYGPNAANDNNAASIWAAASDDAHATWTVDLEETQSISRVEVVTRQDLNQPVTRKNFEVRASNSASFSSYVVLAQQGNTTLADACATTITLTP